MLPARSPSVTKTRVVSMSSGQGGRQGGGQGVRESALTASLTKLPGTTCGNTPQGGNSQDPPAPSKPARTGDSLGAEAPPSLPQSTGKGPRTDLHRVTEHKSKNADAGGGNEDQSDPEPPEHGDTEDTSATQTVRVPSPRRGDGDDRCLAPVANRVRATFTTGPDGALWITIHGADVQEVAAKINAVCAVLTANWERDQGTR